MMPILQQSNPESENETILGRTILAKNLCWLSIDETDINKRIEYNERALRHYRYIPSYFWLGKWYSIRGYLDYLKSNSGYQNDKTNAENCFQKCFHEITNHNQKVIEQKRGKEIINHHLFNEWGSHFYRWGDYQNGIEKYNEEIEEIKRYRNYQAYQNNVKNIFSARINKINCSCKSGAEPRVLYRELQELLKENPYHPYVYMTLGVLNHKTKNYDKALQCFNTSIEIKPDNYYPYWHKARLFLETDKRNEAKSCFNKALEIIHSSQNEINKIKLSQWGKENGFIQ